jgi:hypothetical protein
MPENPGLIRIAVQLGFSFALTVVIAACAFCVMVCVAGTG